MLVAHALRVDWLLDSYTAVTPSVVTAVQRHSFRHRSYVRFPPSTIYIIFPNLCKNERFRASVVLKHVECRDDAVRLIGC